MWVWVLGLSEDTGAPHLESITASHPLASGASCMQQHYTCLPSSVPAISDTTPTPTTNAHRQPQTKHSAPDFFIYTLVGVQQALCHKDCQFSTVDGVVAGPAAPWHQHPGVALCVVAFIGRTEEGKRVGCCQRLVWALPRRPPDTYESTEQPRTGSVQNRFSPPLAGGAVVAAAAAAAVAAVHTKGTACAARAPN